MKEVVLPVPFMEVCIAIDYQAAFRPEQSKTLAADQWTVETMDWKKLPTGEYELRAPFGPLFGIGPDQGLPYLLPPHNELQGSGAIRRYRAGGSIKTKMG